MRTKKNSIIFYDPPIQPLSTSELFFFVIISYYTSNHWVPIYCHPNKHEQSDFNKTKSECKKYQNNIAFMLQ